MNVFIILSLTVSYSVTALAVQSTDHELQFVTIVYRHGDRSPVDTFPNNPHGNESLWNNGWGELTTAGKQRAYAFGKWLRERYANFLPEIYNKNDIEVQSTDFSRTLMSAYLVLSGLYEPTGTDVWHPNIKWQPIPVHTMPTYLDNLLAAGKTCPKHTKLMLELMLSKEITSQLNAELLSEVVTLAGYSPTALPRNLLRVGMIYDNLFVQQQNGYELPKWAAPYYPQPLQDICSLMLRIPSYNPALQRLSYGLLVKDIVDHFKLKSKGKLRKKMWHYSAHDATIVGLRQCLGIHENDLPPYSSAVILELSVKNGQHYIKVLYKTDNELKTYNLPGCGEYCPLNKFEELMTPIIPLDWDAECALTN